LSTGFGLGVVQDAPEWVVSPVLTLFSGRHFMHVRRALALTLAVPVLLAGCSDDPEPTPKMPEPTSSSPSPSPTESEEPEAESPEEFIRRWVEVGDEMQMTGDVAEFKRMSRNCQACAQVVAQVKSIYASGGSIEFSGTRVALLKEVAPEPPTFHVDLNTPETVIRTESGAVEQRLPAGVGKYLLTLNGKPGRWYVAAYARR
jgi:hypothetical protein